MAFGHECTTDVIACEVGTMAIVNLRQTQTSKERTQLRNCVHQAGLWACLRGSFLMIGSERGCAVDGLVGLEYVKEVAE